MNHYLLINNEEASPTLLGGGVLADAQSLEGEGEVVRLEMRGDLVRRRQ